MVASVIMLAVSCSDNSVNVTETGSEQVSSSATTSVTPLSSWAENEAFGNLALHAKKGWRNNRNDSEAGGFNSPIFGIATAHNGDILVAELLEGISNIKGTTDIPLVGISDIGPIGRHFHWVTTSGPDGTIDDGQAMHLVSKGKTRTIANLFAFEEENDPDGHVESNPFDVQSLGARAALVADAAGNDLLKVNIRGHVRVLAVFPPELVSTDNVKNLRIF